MTENGISSDFLTVRYPLSANKLKMYIEAKAITPERVSGMWPIPYRETGDFNKKLQPFSVIRKQRHINETFRFYCLGIFFIMPAINR